MPVIVQRQCWGYRAEQKTVEVPQLQLFGFVQFLDRLLTCSSLCNVVELIVACRATDHGVHRASLPVRQCHSHGFFVEVIQLFAKWSRSCGVSATDHGGIVNEFFVEARALGTCVLGDEAGCPAGQGGSGQDAPKTVEVPQLQFLTRCTCPSLCNDRWVCGRPCDHAATCRYSVNAVFLAVFVAWGA